MSVTTSTTSSARPRGCGQTALPRTTRRPRSKRTPAPAGPPGIAPTGSAWPYEPATGPACPKERRREDTVRDVVPADPNDPHGAAFSAMLLPLVITSIIAGVVLTLMAGPAPWRLAGLGLFAIGGSAATAGIGQP